MKLIQQLVDINSPSGNEESMKQFLLNYVSEHSSRWAVKPEVLDIPELMGNLILVFGQPTTAIFAHMDTTGFTVRYEDQLVPIGGPEVENGYQIVGEDSKGPIACKLRVSQTGTVHYDFPRVIDRGTNLTWKPSVTIDNTFIQGTYLDNRLGLYNALKVAETLENGVIVFSTYEEHGGGAIPLLMNYLLEKYPIRQALISDITWVTEGVHHGEGVVISLRDRHIPRKVFLDRIVQLARESGIPFQLEVEGHGSSDGREVHFSPHPVDWCFIGAAEDYVHSPKEKVHIRDLECMVQLYQYLMKKL